LLLAKPKLDLTPENEKNDGGGEERPASTLGAATCEEGVGGLQGNAGATGGGKNVHKIAREMLTVGSRKG
jgi:hypothetical protein